MSATTQHKFILDNQQNTVADYLRVHLPDSEVLRLVSAYLSIFGYKAKQNELSGLGDVQFLFSVLLQIHRTDTLPHVC